VLAIRCQQATQKKAFQYITGRPFCYSKGFYSLAITMTALMAKTPPGKVQLLGFSCG
jgi:hypothetical protein